MPRMPRTITANAMRFYISRLDEVLAWTHHAMDADGMPSAAIDDLKNAIGDAQFLRDELLRVSVTEVEVETWR